MTLEPDEVQAQAFRQRLRGYDPHEVDALLDRVAAALREREQRSERLAAERDRAQERAQAAEARADRAEELVRAALDRLPREQEVPRARAEEDAETIRRKAREQAAEAHRAARDEIARMVAALQGAAAAHQELRETLEDLAERAAALADAQRDAVDHDAVRDHLVGLVAATERSRQEVAPSRAEPATPEDAPAREATGADEGDEPTTGPRGASPGETPGERGDAPPGEAAGEGVERLPVPPLLLSRRRGA